MGDASRGKELFRTGNCILCHSANGEGGNEAPDLARAVERGYSPYQLAAVLWDHAPAMWALMAKKGIPRPQLTEQDAADLFAYFFAARYFEMPADSGRGKQVFRSKQCGLCHGVTSPAREGVKPVAQWQSLDNPIALAQQMWNHASEMRTAHDQAKLPYPRLTPQPLTDLLGYLRGLVGSENLEVTAGSVYIERTSVSSPKNILKTKKAIRKAFDTQLADKGFSMVEILSPCPTNWKMTPLEANKWVDETMTKFFPLKVIKDVA